MPSTSSRPSASRSRTPRAETTGSGSLTNGSQTTNASGIATVGSWKLGTTAGTNNNTLTATSTGLTGNPRTFTASATADAATTIAIDGGNNQSATVDANVATAPSALVTDQFGNPVTTGPDSTINVTETIQTGGGSLQGTVTKAAVGGVATFTNLRIDTSGAHTLHAAGTLSGPGAVSIAGSASERA